MNILIAIVFTTIFIFLILKSKLIRIFEAVKAVEANQIQLNPNRELHIAKRFSCYEELVLALDSFLKLFLWGNTKEEFLTACLQLMRIRHKIRQDVDDHIQWVGKRSQISFFIRTSKINEKTLFGRIVKSSVPDETYYTLNEKLALLD